MKGGNDPVWENDPLVHNTVHLFVPAIERRLESLLRRFANRKVYSVDKANNPCIVGIVGILYSTL